MVHKFTRLHDHLDGIKYVMGLCKLLVSTQHEYSCILKQQKMYGHSIKGSSSAVIQVLGQGDKQLIDS